MRREFYFSSEKGFRKFLELAKIKDNIDESIEHERAHFDEAKKRGYTPNYVVTLEHGLFLILYNFAVEVKEEIRSFEDMEAIAAAPGIRMSDSDEAMIRSEYFQRRLKGVEQKC